MTERFVEVGRSEVPPGMDGGHLGSAEHPVVVQVSVSGPRPYVALSQGSGHLGSGAVFPVDYVLMDSGELEPPWPEHFERAGATWVVPFLRDLLAGHEVTEEQVVAEVRRRRGADPAVETLPVDPDVTADELRARRRERQRRTRR